MPDSFLIKIIKLALVVLVGALLSSLLLMSARGLEGLLLLIPAFVILILSGVVTAILIRDNIFAKLLYAIVAIGLGIFAMSLVLRILERLFR